MKHLLILLFFLCSMSVSAQDVIVKKDGSTIVCRVVELTESEIVYKKWSDMKGPSYVMERSAASAINYQNGKKVNLSQATNLYKPNNQNDGTQQYNDRALLNIDAAEHPKIIRKFRWNIMAGYSLDSYTGGSNLSSTSGFDFQAGALFPCPQSDLCIGTDIFFASNGAKVESESAMQLRIGVCPYVGYSIPISDGFSLVPYIGPFVSFRIGGDYSASYRSHSPSFRSSYESKKTDFGVHCGVNFFFSKNFYANFHIRKGITKVGEEIYFSYDDYYSDRSPNDIKSIKYVIALGCTF